MNVYLSDGRILRNLHDERELATFRWMRELKGYGAIVERVCPACTGVGEVPKDDDEDPCTDCDGDGEVECLCDKCNVWHERECASCKGKGYTERDPEVSECTCCDGDGHVLVEPGADVRSALRCEDTADRPRRRSAA